jgi:hypothetical protein
VDGDRRDRDSSQFDEEMVAEKSGHRDEDEMLIAEVHRSSTKSRSTGTTSERRSTERLGRNTYKRTSTDSTSSTTCMSPGGAPHSPSSQLDNDEEMAAQHDASRTKLEDEVLFELPAGEWTSREGRVQKEPAREREQGQASHGGSNLGYSGPEVPVTVRVPAPPDTSRPGGKSAFKRTVVMDTDGVAFQKPVARRKD